MYFTLLLLCIVLSSAVNVHDLLRATDADSEQELLDVLKQVKFTADRFCATLPIRYIARHPALNLTDDVRYEVYSCLLKEQWIHNASLYSPKCSSFIGRSMNRPWRNQTLFAKNMMLDCLYECVFIFHLVSLGLNTTRTVATHTELKAFAVGVQYEADLAVSTNHTNRQIPWHRLGLNTSHYATMRRCPQAFHKRYTLLDYFAWNNITLPLDLIRLSELLLRRR